MKEKQSAGCRKIIAGKRKKEKEKEREKERDRERKRKREARSERGIKIQSRSCLAFHSRLFLTRSAKSQSTLETRN